MADVQPLRALRYDPAVAGSLQALAAPPYDVIDPRQRAELAAQSPYNVVALDLPEAPDGGDPLSVAIEQRRGLLQHGSRVRQRLAPPVLELGPRLAGRTAR